MPRQDEYTLGTQARNHHDLPGKRFARSTNGHRGKGMPDYTMPEDKSIAEVT